MMRRRDAVIREQVAGDAMSAAQGGSVQPVDTEKGWEPTVFGVDGYFPQFAAGIGAPDGLFIRPPGEHLAVCLTIVEVDQTLAPAVLED